MAAPNRRSFYRQSMSTPVYVQAAGVRASVPATLVDISGGGCNIQSRMQFRTGTSLRFELLTLDGRLTLEGTVKLARYSVAERLFSYGVEFTFVEEPVRQQLVKLIGAERLRLRNRIVSTLDPKEREERAPRIRADIPVTYAIDALPGNYHGFATDVSVGGMRLETDRALRRDSTLRVYFSLPDRPATTFGVDAHALPGVRTRNAIFIHRIRFDNLDANAAHELERFILKPAR